MTPMNVLAKSEVRSFKRSWDHSDWSFGLGLRTSTLVRAGVGRRGRYRPKEHWWVAICPAYKL